MSWTPGLVFYSPKTLVPTTQKFKQIHKFNNISTRIQPKTRSKPNKQSTQS